VVRAAFGRPAIQPTEPCGPAGEKVYPNTESGDAEFFASLHADDLRFDHRRDRWLIVDHASGIWLPDRTNQVVGLATKAMRRRQVLAAMSNADDRKDSIRWAQTGENRNRLNNLLALAEDKYPLADDGASWDQDPWLLGTRQGVVDLRTGEFRTARPGDRITMRANVAFDPLATCPVWTGMLAEIFEGHEAIIPFLQRSLGYSLTGDCREECLMLLYGEGRNGKGTILATVAFILGDYADNLPFNSLVLHRFSASAIPNDIAKLVGKRFVTANESNKDQVRLNEALIKTLTGRDVITARFLNQEFFNFVPVAKFWLSTNAKPEIHDTSLGFWSRIRLVPFNNTFDGRENKKLKDQLRVEAPGILNWMIAGCLAWQQNEKGLDPPEEVLLATKQYQNESEQVGRFLTECCVQQPTARGRDGELYEKYKGWCVGANEPPSYNRRTFTDQMKKRFQVDASNTQRVVYVGVGLVASDTGPGSW
ncbi:MAG TPA: phage/plasmid primase, P4 family, partial [Vicinamibacterales bacterium]